MEFEVVDPEAIPQATLTVTGLVSRLGSSPGYAPIDVLLEGEALAEELTVPGGGDLPTDNVFAVPARLLKPGGNTLEIRTSAEARSMFWLYRITLDSIDERGRSERARAAQAAQDSVFAYRTELRAPFADTSSSSSESWEVGPRLLFHIDRDEHSLPAQLNWRAADGAESAISFQSNMSGFHGSHRAADGTVYEYRGHLNGSWAFPEGLDDASESRLHRFRTEEGWGGGWHASHELRLLVDDGPVPVERVSWRDQRGNSGVVMLQSATGDLKVTGVAASEEFDGGGEGAANLLDDARNKWLAFDDTALLDFTLARPAVVSSYSLRSANDAPGRDPATGRSSAPSTATPGRRWTPAPARPSPAASRPGTSSYGAPPTPRPTATIVWRSVPTPARTRPSSPRSVSSKPPPVRGSSATTSATTRVPSAIAVRRSPRPRPTASPRPAWRRTSRRPCSP